MNQPLKLALAAVERRIEDACARAGRRRNEVNMIAVTKYVSVERTREVMQAGLIHIGENRWQDAKEKWESLHAESEGIWHFIGHLQTNKVKDVIGKFQYIHSLDRLSLAEELQKKASRLELNVRCFVQLNVSGEATKYGLPPEELIPFLRQTAQFPNLEIIGLMTMAPQEEVPERTRPVFRELRRLMAFANEQKAYSQPLTELSMGMSNDFEVAVEEGATWIRLGSVLVGKDE